MLKTISSWVFFHQRYFVRLLTKPESLIRCVVLLVFCHRISIPLYQFAFGVFWLKEKETIHEVKFVFIFREREESWSSKEIILWKLNYGCNFGMYACCFILDIPIENWRLVVYKSWLILKSLISIETVNCEFWITVES